MSKYTSTRPVSAKLQMYIDNSYSVDSFVAILDREHDTHYHIAKILDLGEHTTTVHYYATYGNRLRSATWKPLYQLPHTNQIVMEKPDTINRNRTQWTGTVDTQPVGKGLIILSNIGMTANMKVNSRARKILRSMTTYSHHILTNTWMRT